MTAAAAAVAVAFAFAVGHLPDAVEQKSWSPMQVSRSICPSGCCCMVSTGCKVGRRSSCTNAFAAGVLQAPAVTVPLSLGSLLSASRCMTGPAVCGISCKADGFVVDKCMT